MSLNDLLQVNLNDLLELIRWGINGAFDLFLHAVWSGAASLLAFCLTCWVSRGAYSLLATRSQSPTSMPTALERDILRLGYSVALFASLSAHLLLDGFMGPC